MVDQKIPPVTELSAFPPNDGQSSQLLQQSEALDFAVDTAAATATTTTVFRFWHLDVVEQILKRLPVCSVVKCMSVCKQWYSLIKTQEFITTHLRHKIESSPPTFLIGQRNPSLCRDVFSLYSDSVFYEKDDQKRKKMSSDNVTCLSQSISFPFRLKKHADLKIIGSIHGLICFNVNGANSYIWNPFINRYLIIPESYTDLRSEFRYGVIGFGFASSRNDYEIVRLIFSRSPSICMQGGVYSLKKRAWRALDVTEVRYWIIREGKRSSCLTNGALHWLAEGSGRRFILSFDMNDESFNRVELPAYELSIDEKLSISNVNGNLSIFDFDISRFNRGDYSCNIWSLQNHSTGNSWTKMNGMLIKGLIKKRLDELAAGQEHTESAHSSKNAIFYAKEYCESLLLLDRDDDVVDVTNVEAKKSVYEKKKK